MRRLDKKKGHLNTNRNKAYSFLNEVHWYDDHAKHSGNEVC